MNEKTIEFDTLKKQYAQKQAAPAEYTCKDHEKSPAPKNQSVPAVMAVHIHDTVEHVAQAVFGIDSDNPASRIPKMRNAILFLHDQLAFAELSLGALVNLGVVGQCPRAPRW